MVAAGLATCSASKDCAMATYAAAANELAVTQPGYCEMWSSSHTDDELVDFEYFDTYICSGGDVSCAAHTHMFVVGEADAGGSGILGGWALETCVDTCESMSTCSMATYAEDTTEHTSAGYVHP